MALLTFGYGRLDEVGIRALIETHDVDLVVDIRLMPWGRHPFRGPQETAATVRAGGARYRWLRGLGNVNYRSDGPVVLADAAAAATVVAELEAGHNVALMCVCPNPEDCHRLDVVALVRAARPEVEVVHL